MLKDKVNLSAILFGMVMFSGAVLHFSVPEIYNPFIPDFFAKLFVNYVAGFIELLLAIGLFNKKYRNKAALGVLVLMILFLPLHFIDMFKDAPAIGSKELAYVRFPIQLVLIYWAYTIRKKTRIATLDQEKPVE